MGGVRSHFALREGDDWVASFSAVMVMSGLLTINLSAALALFDVWRSGEPVSAGWISHNRGAYVLGALGVAGVHALLGWREGVVQAKRPRDHPCGRVDSGFISRSLHAWSPEACLRS